MLNDTMSCYLKGFSWGDVNIWWTTVWQFNINLQGVL